MAMETVKIVCFYGPESTGKSTMTRRMAEFYKTEFVPEVSRELITSNNFTLDDIVKIGSAQTERVFQKLKTANKILFCDSDLITTQIYSRHYLNEVPPVLYELEKKVKYDEYFLFDVDVPWVPDGLRDLADQRKEMYEVFKNELLLRGLHYIPVQGSWAARGRTVIDTVNRLIEK